MDPFQRVTAQLAAKDWYLELSSSLFQFNDVEMVAALENLDDVHQSWQWCQEQANASSLHIEKLVELYQEVNRLSERIQTASGHVSQRREILNVLVDVFKAGKSLVQQHSVLEALTEGFSLSGSRDRVHDSDFKKFTVYLISEQHVHSLMLNVATLINHGRLVPFSQSSHENQLNVGKQKLSMEAIQTLLRGFGAAMSMMPPAVLYAHQPRIWEDLQQIATDCSKPLSFVQRLLKETPVITDLGGALSELEAFIEDARQQSNTKVSLDGFFSSKKGIKALRRVLTTAQP